MRDPARLSAGEVVAAIRSGELTAVEVTQACLARIAERDGDVRAWLSLNPDAEAEAARIGPGDPRPLAGLPVGIKDVFDTVGLPTTHNSPLFAGNRPSCDAAAVAQLRAAGAVVIGKTDTTEFAAAGRNAGTSHPMDRSRTPGGSSAGSAAAVADCHVPLALSTQTGGSTIRPASFCGIVGMKPSYGLISTEGMKRYAPSFDTVGFHVRDPRDLALLARVFDLGAASSPPSQLKLGLCLTPYADKILAEMVAAMETIAERIADIARCVTFDLPEGAEDLDELHRTVMFAEGAASFLPLAGRAELHSDFRERIASRTSESVRGVFGARDRLTDLTRNCETMMDVEGIDAILAPAAPGHAPEGRGPGDPILNSLWTAMQMPCVALPVGTAGLPLGIQLIGRRGTDADLIGAATAIAPALIGERHAAA
ncbi:amidase [Palleronia sp. LCG004]|uniref:amidase n=1 Tax=Palleronia sp. LCG004 TaxID=3079304 RepID=UPI0029430FEE|nr:amidase [Palleronia sp. LCG004]WOI58025.1 amidase [Palleronia sp. LCG004]